MPTFVIVTSARVAASMPVLVSGMLKIAPAGQLDVFESALFSFVIARDPKDMRCAARNV